MAVLYYYRDSVNLFLIISWLSVTIGAVQNFAQIDGTLTQGTSGVNVVNAVLEKIDFSDVFSESDWFRDNGKKSLAKQFLRYKAYVDSKDGKVTIPGGIWSVNQSQLSETKANTDRKIMMRMRESSVLKHIDWMTVNHMDLMVPLNSGLASMLLLDKVLRLGTNSEDLLKTKTQLTELWQRHFSPDHDKTRWLQAVNEVDESTCCSIRSDVVFVIDASNSITEADFEEAKNVVKDFTNKLVTSDGDNRIGIVLIRTFAVVYLELGDGLTHNNKNKTLQAIDKIPYIPYHFTNTADGLCKMSQQPWKKNDSSVLDLAIVLTDGKSNHVSEECGGDINHVADYVRHNHSNIIVFTIGIGDKISTDELSLIASGSHLVTILDDYSDVRTIVEDSLHYQICYVFSEPLSEGEQAHGEVRDGQIVRWTLQGMSTVGTTIRLCVTNGALTLYVSYLPAPSEVLNDKQSSIATTSKLAIDCTTVFTGLSNLFQRKRRQASQNHTTTIYMSIVGRDNDTVYFLNSERGNVSFDVDECGLEPYPCDVSASCHNTDGSYYCECHKGFSGDGFECTGRAICVQGSNCLAIILSSFLLSLVILILLAIVVTSIFLRRHRTSKSAETPNTACTSKDLNTIPKIYENEIQFVLANLRKVSKATSATTKS